ncbi:MAG TPA: hypothetical protein VGL81_03010 [Polyangiaceae bacterium]
MKGFVLGGGLLLVLAACQAESAPRGLEATCAKSCEVRASQCSPHQCRLGCNLVMDRLAESQGDTVLACVSRATKACDQFTWSRCATLIGVHADGGPPPPPPPPDVVDTDSD